MTRHGWSVVWLGIIETHTVVKPCRFLLPELSHSCVLWSNLSAPHIKIPGRMYIECNILDLGWPATTQLYHRFEEWWHFCCFCVLLMWYVFFFSFYLYLLHHDICNMMFWYCIFGPCRYTPDGNAEGADEFSFDMQVEGQSDLGSRVGVVDLSVVRVNQPPIALNVEIRSPMAYSIPPFVSDVAAPITLKARDLDSVALIALIDMSTISAAIGQLSKAEESADDKLETIEISGKEWGRVCVRRAEHKSYLQQCHTFQCCENCGHLWPRTFVDVVCALAKRFASFKLHLRSNLMLKIVWHIPKYWSVCGKSATGDHWALSPSSLRGNSFDIQMKICVENSDTAYGSATGTLQV